MTKSPRGKTPLSKLWSCLCHGRTLSQLLFTGLLVWIGIQMVSHPTSSANIERYCPFGGMETLLPWLKGKGTWCSLSTINIAMLLGVLLITLVFKRAFCSHICPVGTIAEWTAKLGRFVPFLPLRVPKRVDRALKWLKYPVLVLILYLTYVAQDLIFRQVDPFYVLFTFGKGHEVAGFSMPLILGIIAIGVAIPMVFCRYLCPFAACLTPFARISPVQVHRDKSKCIDCGACDKACDWAIDVSSVAKVTTGECSLCQDCIRKCPVPGTLYLGVGGPIK